MRITLIGIACGVIAGGLVAGPALAGCGHDVHGGGTFEVTELGENHSVAHYISPSTIIMDDASDPRHRAFGECRGQAVIIDGVANWIGACINRDADGDVWVAHWSSEPGDTGTENREALHGTFTVGVGNTGKYAGKKWAGKWTGLASGGSYFCED